MVNHDHDENLREIDVEDRGSNSNVPQGDNWMEEETSEGQLMVDMYQTPDEIVIQTMVAGVKLDDLNVSIGRDMVTVKGKRETQKNVDEEDFFYQELYFLLKYYQKI